MWVGSTGMDGTETRGRSRAWSSGVRGAPRACADTVADGDSAQEQQTGTNTNTRTSRTRKQNMEMLLALARQLCRIGKATERLKALIKLA